MEFKPCFGVSDDEDDDIKVSQMINKKIIKYKNTDIYQYDEIYDKINKKNPIDKFNTKSKYISKMKEKFEERKLDTIITDNNKIKNLENYSDHNVYYGKEYKKLLNQALEVSNNLIQIKIEEIENPIENQQIDPEFKYKPILLPSKKKISKCEKILKAKLKLKNRKNP